MARWFDPKKIKVVTLLGTGCCLAIIAMCASSTPVMAVFFAVLAAALFPLRNYMRLLRWGFFFMLLGLHMVMKKPVWHLVSRVGVVSGSTGDHRYRLIQAAVDHFHEWWMLGTADTASWGPQLNDTANQFILVGVRGGLISMILFIVILGLAFRNTGRLRKAAEKMGNRPAVIYAWALGIMIFVHVTCFFGVDYFGQITMLIWMPLAISASLLQQYSQPALQNQMRATPVMINRPLYATR